MRVSLKRFFCDAGNPERAVYSSSLQKDGKILVKITGYENIQDQINSHAESCSIELIIARCSRGDFSGLSARQGVYADITGMPTTYADVLQKVIDGRNLFDSLPKDVRERFANDFNQWFAQTGSSEWFEKMGVKSPVVEKPVLKSDSVSNSVKEVVLNES